MLENIFNNFADIMFFAFSAFLLIGALGVIMSKNPAYSILCMILSFFNASGLFILMGAEFLGLLLVMVYVGAIAVMFLFVLMTIDIDFAELKTGFAKYAPFGLFVGAVLAFEIIFAIQGGLFSGLNSLQETAALSGAEKSNIEQIGAVMFTQYVLPFLAVSIVLLIAMVGAICLTHRKRTDVKRQDINKQLSRTREQAVELKTVKPGEGI